MYVASVQACKSVRSSKRALRSRGELSPVATDLAFRSPVNLPVGPLGSYRLVRLIGEGGTAQVFLAVHEILGRHVALKILRPEFARRREGIGMLLAEARAVNRIKHPHIAQVTDFVESAHATYLVMEYIEGHTLSREIERGPLDLVRALRITHQVADALTAAHEVGVVHCDLKPDNILLRTEDDATKILDFGVAQYDDDELVERYGTRRWLGRIVGTPRYMSPEQAMGHPVDGRSDIYALGLILYEMITGQPPYVGTREEELACQVASPVPRLRSALPDAALRDGLPSAVDAEVDALVASCMSKSPEERVQDMATLRSTLYRLWSRAAGGSPNTSELISSCDVLTRAEVDSEGLQELFAASRQLADTAVHSTRKATPRRSRQPWVFGAALAAVLLLAFGIRGTYDGEKPLFAASDALDHRSHSSRAMARSAERIRPRKGFQSRFGIVAKAQ